MWPVPKPVSPWWEGGGNIVSETEMLEAIFFGHEQLQPIIGLQEKLMESAGVEKRVFAPKEKGPGTG